MTGGVQFDVGEFRGELEVLITAGRVGFCLKTDQVLLAQYLLQLSEIWLQRTGS